MFICKIVKVWAPQQMVDSKKIEIMSVLLLLYPLVPGTVPDTY